MSFEQRLLNAAGVSSIKDVLAQSTTEPEFNKRVMPLQKQSLLSSHFENATIQDVKEIFGDEFYSEMMSLPLNQWHGFVESTQGFHLVKVSEIENERFSDFLEIKTTVKNDWMESHKRQWLLEQLESLREKCNFQTRERNAS